MGERASEEEGEGERETGREPGSAREQDSIEVRESRIPLS